MQIFEEVLFFKLPTKKLQKNPPTEKHPINSTYLVLAGCGRLAEGKGHETDTKWSCTKFTSGKEDTPPKKKKKKEEKKARSH